MPIIERKPGLYEIGEQPKRCPNCGGSSSRIVRTRHFTASKTTIRDRVCRICGRKYETTANWD